tara:strand:- start:5136 stop:6140 length:1005 start_codon:yes stop_codon:yes gene_type:complete
MRILLTSCGGFFVNSLSQELKRDKSLKNLHIIGIDEKKIKKSKYIDKIFQIKKTNETKYINQVLKICEQNSLNLIIPLSDKESLRLSKYKIRFKKSGVTILVNDYKLMKKINDKRYVYKKIQKEKIKTPRFYLVKNYSGFLAKLKNLKFPKKPIVLKPKNSAGGRGIIILKSTNKKINDSIQVGKREKKVDIKNFNFQNYLKKFKDFIMMEYLVKPSYDVDYFKLKNKQLISVRERLNPSGIPYKGNIIKHNRKIELYCKRIARVLDLKGLVDFDIMHNEKNEPVLLELNPRPSGSVVVNHFAGFKFLSIILKIIYNKKINFSTKFRGVKKIII